MSDRIAVMDHGRVLQLGRPGDIYERPNCRFVADFIGEANVLPGSLFGFEAPYVAIRPERVLLSTKEDTENNGFRGHVIEVVYLGATTSCTVALHGGPVVKVERSDLPTGLGPDRTVVCHFPHDALLPLES